jgi:hypothetical protein
VPDPTTEPVTPDPAVPDPDGKDWTHVITGGCAACGFVPPAAPEGTGDRLRAAVPRWQAALARPDAAVRPEPAVWSAVEYAAHVRDVAEVFGSRLALMLTEDDPEFANWDQDETALAERYWEQSAAVVGRDLDSGVGALAAAFDEVGGEQWDRTGRRSNGSVFTVSTLATYLLHDVEHHLHDVGA